VAHRRGGNADAIFAAQRLAAELEQNTGKLWFFGGRHKSGSARGIADDFYQPAGTASNQSCLDKLKVKVQHRIMKLKKFRPKALPLLIVIAIGAAVWLLWHFSPAATKSEIFRSNIFGDFYSTHNHLGNLLKIGMTPDEVHSILGEPDIKRTMTNGFRWSYGEEGPTASGICVVDFSMDGKTAGLCFFVNVENTVFYRESPHHEFGNPIDNGKFDLDFCLKRCWDEWHKKKQ
jgi:hypothetical protein